MLYFPELRIFSHCYYCIIFVLLALLFDAGYLAHFVFLHVISDCLLVLCATIFAFVRVLCVTSVIDTRLKRVRRLLGVLERMIHVILFNISMLLFYILPRYITTYNYVNDFLYIYKTMISHIINSNCHSITLKEQSCIKNLTTNNVFAYSHLNSLVRVVTNRSLTDEHKGATLHSVCSLGCLRFSYPWRGYISSKFLFIRLVTMHNIYSISTFSDLCLLLVSLIFITFQLCSIYTYKTNKFAETCQLLQTLEHIELSLIFKTNKSCVHAMPRLRCRLLWLAFVIHRCCYTICSVTWCS
jgi:hypothetical protein